MRQPVATTMILALALALALGACGGKKKDEKKGAGQSTSKSPAVTLVAAPKEAAQSWLPPNRQGSTFAVASTRIYDDKTIFELLNGGADQLIDEGLMGVLHVRIVDGTKTISNAEIQIMAARDVAGAKRLMAREKPSDGRRVKLGDRAFASKGLVLFLKGRHLVKVAAMPRGNQPLAPVSEIARLIERSPNAKW